jgi:hypothetical protein
MAPNALSFFYYLFIYYYFGAGSMFTPPQTQEPYKPYENSLEILSSFHLSCAVIWILEITDGYLF